MPSHSETIQYATQAVAAYETTLGHIANAASELDTVEPFLRAAFDGTHQLASLGQHHEQAKTSIGGAGHAVTQLISELSAALARFQG
jgi:hypothetical protein